MNSFISLESGTPGSRLILPDNNINYQYALMASAADDGMVRYRRSSSGLRRLGDNALSPEPERGVTDQSKDNESTSSSRQTPHADPHGHAAYLLVESLLHTLVARSIVPLRDAIEVVEVAGAARIEIGYDVGESQAGIDRTLAILAKLESSLRTYAR